jgi:hypothetical protein
MPQIYYNSQQYKAEDYVASTQSQRCMEGNACVREREREQITTTKKKEDGSY